MIRGGNGAETTPCSSHDLLARFSRLLTSTKYFAGSTSNWELSSYPITTVQPFRLMAGKSGKRDRGIGGDRKSASRMISGSLCVLLFTVRTYRFKVVGPFWTGLGFGATHCLTHRNLVNRISPTLNDPIPRVAYSRLFHKGYVSMELSALGWRISKQVIVSTTPVIVVHEPILVRSPLILLHLRRG
jgi:hypothetical protein